MKRKHEIYDLTQPNETVFKITARYYSAIVCSDK